MSIFIHEIFSILYFFNKELSFSILILKKLFYICYGFAGASELIMAITAMNNELIMGLPVQVILLWPLHNFYKIPDSNYPIYCDFFINYLY